MNVHDHLLSCLAEECAEIIQRIEKAKRFGCYEIQPGQKFTNVERVVEEINDFMGALETCQDHGVLPKPTFSYSAIQAKKEKIVKYMEYARSIGALEKAA